MRRFLLLLVIPCFLVSGLVLAQKEPSHESVHGVVPEMSSAGADTGQVLYLLNLAKKAMDTLPEKALPLIRSALGLAIKEKNTTHKAESFFLLGDYYLNNRLYLQALQQYLSARNNYLISGDTGLAIMTILRIGYVNQYLNHYESACNFIFQALAFAQQNKDINMQGRCYSDLASVYQLKGEYLKADSLYMISISWYKKSGNTPELLRVLNEQGNTLIDQKKYDEALILYKNLLGQADSILGRVLAVINTKIGHIYEMKHDYSQSLFYNFKAMEIRRKCGESSICSSWINIAGDFFDLNQVDSAMFYLNKGMTMAKKLNQLHLVVNGYRHLYEFYEKRGDFKQAYDYYTQYSALHEELLVERNKTSIRVIEVRKELIQKIESGNQLRKKNRIQALTLARQQYSVFIVRVLAVIAGIVLVILYIVYFYNQRAKNRLQVIQGQLTLEIRDRELKELQTRTTEQKFRFLSENSIDFVTFIDQNMKRQYASPSCRSLYGYEPEEMLQKTTLDLIHPDFHASAEGSMKEMLETKQPQKNVNQALRKDGQAFWVESVSNPLFDTITGEFKGIVAVTRDIHERKLKEFEIMEGTKQKENLLKEIHHRVKNNFAILVSLINMQMSQSKDPGLVKSLTNLQLRIRSMALVHEMLYRSKDFERISFSEYIRSLASVISGTFNRRDVKLNIEAEEAVLNIDSSIPLGLIVNELISNAYMHAFPEGRPGTISVAVKHVPEEKIFYLIIRDDGIGLPLGFSIDHVNTMGLQIVQLLSKQIEGELVVENNPGASFTIRFQQLTH